MDPQTIQSLRFLYTQSKRELEKLRLNLTVDREELTNLFGAGRRFDGFPDYYRNFFRDSALSVLLMQYPAFSRDLLILASLLQGSTRNPFTAEEPGKIFHEYPGVTLGRKNTQFNAIDVNPLYLVVWDTYVRGTKDWGLAASYRNAIYSATTFMVNHIGRAIYWEDPANSNAKRFALKATYWRDGGIAGRQAKALCYPAAFTLVQAQAIAGLRAAAHLASRIDIGYGPLALERFADDLLEALLRDFWDEKRESFPSAIDTRGKIFAPYSDPLHILFYLRKDDLPARIVERIFRVARFLETPFGYVTYRENKKRKREFIAEKIWPWEAAIIAASALKYERVDIARKAFRVLSPMAQSERCFSEYLEYDPETSEYRMGGCHVQLWSVAAVWALRRLYREYKEVL